MRPNGRANSALRPVTLDIGVSRYAEGSCLAKFGETHVLCTASVDENVPRWMKGRGSGWVTGEYGMLPRATHTRGRREAASGKQSGRTQEIQRLIGRSLRAVTDMKALGERQIVLDCDVIQADGGTRTAAITGAWVALYLACKYLKDEGVLTAMPIREPAAAVSVGIVDGESRLDLEYIEDSRADADANFVFSASGGIIEIQASAEADPFPANQFDELLGLARSGISELVDLQKKVVGLD